MSEKHCFTAVKKIKKKENYRSTSLLNMDEKALK